MNARKFDFRFGPTACRTEILDALPALKDICPDHHGGLLVICDANTEKLARAIIADEAGVALSVLDAGEAAKGWPSVESVLKAAVNAGIGRDGIFVGIGGGVITDLAACRL